MNWVQLYDGSKLFLHDDGRTVSFEHLEPATLAHHLATTNRWSGAAAAPYSVAQHSLSVAMIVRHLLGEAPAPLALARAMLHALLHDAHEGFQGGDTSTPLKEWRARRGEAVHDEEAAFDTAIRAELGAPAPGAEMVIVQRADKLALTSEAKALLLGGPRDNWTDRFPHDPNIVAGDPMSWDLARMMYRDALESALAMHAAFAPPVIVAPRAPALLLPAS